MRRRWLRVLPVVAVLVGIGAYHSTSRLSEAGRLKADLDAVTVTMGLHPPERGPAIPDPAGTGLRSLTLHSIPRPGEPHAYRSDTGEFISADQITGAAGLAAVIDELDATGWLGRAERLYSYSSRVGGEPGRPDREFRVPVPSCEIRVSRQDGKGVYRDLVMTPPWGPESAGLLRRLDARVPGTSLPRMARTIELIP